MKTDGTYTRIIEPRAAAWRSVAWAGGSFDTARRSYTEAVEGTIRTPDHLVLVTLRGGARHLEVTTDGGHRYAGSDRAGAVSFVPADCERRLKLSGVCSEWGSIAWRPDPFDRAEGDGQILHLAPFSNVDDPFVAGLVGEFERLLTLDGGLDPAYCETMSHALARYLTRRYGQCAAGRAHHSWKLPRWCIRRITDYIEAHIAGPIFVADLAELIDVSEGHLHRAFRATAGVTPLAYIHERRIQRAKALLSSERLSVGEVALRVGFVSPSHFTRTFRRVTGSNPSRWRPGE